MAVRSACEMELDFLSATSTRGSCAEVTAGGLTNGEMLEKIRGGILRVRVVCRATRGIDEVELRILDGNLLLI